MMLDHLGYSELAGKLSRALDVCGQYERNVVMTGRSTGATGQEFGDYVVDTVNDSSLDSRWEAYVNA